MPAIESEAKARTKARFDEVFQSYSSLAGVKNKSRKKRTSAEENIVLETFKNQLDLSKESANETTVNTYNAEAESPRFTKNKLRERIPAAEKLSNVSTKEQTQPKMGKKKKKTRMTEPVITGETLLGNSEIRRVEAQSVTNSVEQPSKTVKKKAKDDWIEDRDPTEYNDKDHLIGPLVQMSQEETDELREKIKQKLKLQLSEHYTRNECQTVPLNNEIGMRKRKKKKDLLHASELETSAMSLSELHDTPSKETVLHSQTHVLQDYINKDEDFSESKVKRVKKKTKTVIDDSTGSGIEERKEEKSSSRRVYDDSLILGVYIHRSDKLIIDLMVSRPLVKIHVIDQKTGEYVRKENSINTISSLCEQEGNEYILPLVTQAYDFKRFKSPVPEWDEQILFNERFAYFLQENEDSPNVILFFEILDLCNMDNINPNLEVQVQEKGFRKIAWAFLKLVGANEVHNVDTKLRLQLYYPPSRARIAANTHVYEWWLKYPRNRYPSTLYVTIKGLKLADNADPNSGTLRALQRELGSNMSHSDVQNDTAGSGQGKLKRELFRWTRLPGQACRIPNKHLLSLRAGHMGCFSVCFSNDGRTLAAACADRDDYPVLIYEIPSGQFLRELHGHLNVVYELCWSTCDQHLLTASSDGTARLWNFANETSSAVKVLPHPSFVYTAKFHPMADYLVVTGCYDGVIRVWNIKVKEVNGLLLQEFDGHKSFINTLCFDEEGLQMYSGDSSGLIIIWNTVISRRSQQNPVQHWSILKEIRENDMKGIPVNHLQVHPNGRRLLIHAKDSTLRIMDLRILAANKYIGATNYREKIRSAFTPCGTFVFAGSEDGIAYVWNAETGDQVAKYSELSYTAPLRDVAFHPHEHMVAFCAFGQSQPILVYIFDYKVAQLEAEAVQTPGNLSTFNNPENLSLQESSLSPADRFVSAARTSMRMLKVKQKLDSVLNGTNLMQPAPSLLSPHSKLRLSGPQNTQLIGGTSAFGSFSPVGQPLSRTPSIRLQMSNTDVKVSSLKIEAESMIPVQETVVALYDYTAHRSDELTIHRSDIIHVLYKDNDNWWFGSLANGQQGYFPANYVASEIQHEDDQSSTSVSHDYVHSHKEQFEAEESSMNSLMMSTGPSKSRDVKMMPQNDTDADSPVTHVSRMLQMSSDSSTRMTSPLREPSTSAGSALPEWGQQKQDSNVKPKKKKSLKHISSGKTNNAFEFEPTV